MARDDPALSVARRQGGAGRPVLYECPGIKEESLFFRDGQLASGSLLLQGAAVRPLQRGAESV
jgi:hypothetical protein